MPPEQRIARTLTWRSMPRLLQHAALLVATAALVGVLVGQTREELLRTQAEQGDAEAQFNLGLMSYDGKGVPQDDAEAVKWFRLAAEQGYADAQLSLGVLYANGQGLPQDDAEAIKWYRLAAEQRNAVARFALGLPQDDAC